MTLDQSLSIYTPIWVCTFAICQFGENFGNKLMDCPFIQTLKTVDLTVLIVDYQAGSLSRTWCGLEVHYTTQNEKEFMLYTSAGRVGSTFVSGGPLVEAVKEWDIRRRASSAAMGAGQRVGQRWGGGSSVWRFWRFFLDFFVQTPV
ncbi:Repressor/activator protein 1 homolog (Telomeric repeat-binding factor 2-interacting protein 1) [Durusdinium trenchii]|uniref:Repressor/activator protein 1 homolog (Telomeric repeat-binding factor 2-interacting protein 1) n=1 Tax=Durusdinium trenchii TaxID=1381693 RepID=A0ABP0P899_9DINO